MFVKTYLATTSLSVATMSENDTHKKIMSKIKDRN